MKRSEKSYNQQTGCPTRNLTLHGSGQVMYCFGTLAGDWPYGSRFEGIRFIDRFTFRGDRLADQQVWNDPAETKNNLQQID